MGRALAMALAVAWFAWAALSTAPLHAADRQPQLIGDTRIHDPSVIEVDGRYAAFGTGGPGLYRGAILVKTSPDGVSLSAQSHARY